MVIEYGYIHNDPTGVIFQYPNGKVVESFKNNGEICYWLWLYEGDLQPIYVGTCRNEAIELLRKKYYEENNIPIEKEEK